jgi:hypothetical protein
MAIYLDQHLPLGSQDKYFFKVNGFSPCVSLLGAVHQQFNR